MPIIYKEGMGHNEWQRWAKYPSKYKEGMGHNEWQRWAKYPSKLPPTYVRFFMWQGATGSRWRKYHVYSYDTRGSQLHARGGKVINTPMSHLGASHWKELKLPNKRDTQRYIASVLTHYATKPIGTNKKDNGMKIKIEKNVTLVDGSDIKSFTVEALKDRMTAACNALAKCEAFKERERTVRKAGATKQNPKETYVYKEMVIWQEVFDTLEEELNTRTPE